MKNLRKYYNSGKQSNEWVHLSFGNISGSSGASDFKRTNRTFDKSVSMVQCDGDDVALGMDELGGVFTEFAHEDILEDTE
jgi:pyruvate/2-oxoacid:ferredoxin oxidoreductase beta subunit